VSQQYRTIGGSLSGPEDASVSDCTVTAPYFGVERAVTAVAFEWDCMCSDHAVPGRGEGSGCRTAILTPPSPVIERLHRRAPMQRRQLEESDNYHCHTVKHTLHFGFTAAHGVYSPPTTTGETWPIPLWY